MDRAGPHEDSDGWYQVSLGHIAYLDGKEMEPQIRWCKLHHSEGRFDYGIEWAHAVFRFEQLEDAVMFRLVWASGK